MIAYNHQWLDNRDVQNEAEKAFDAGCLGKEEKDRIRVAYPVGFYSPNMFIRVGLFILTTVIALFTMGLLSMLFISEASENVFGAILLFFALLCYGALELMVNKKHYRSGVDDALMWGAAGCLLGSLNLLMNLSAYSNAAIVCVTAAYFFLRFANAVMAAIAGLAWLAVFFYSIIRLGDAARPFVPFALMAAAALLYFGSERLRRSTRLHRYERGFQLIGILSLIAVCAAGNYYVVREASIAMFGLSLQEGESFPFGWLFWFFTVAIPLFYIARGIQKKSAVLLRVGLLLVAVLVFTVRYYYHVLPAETAMALGGIFLIGIAYTLTRYLYTPRYGFTHKEQDDKFFMDRLHIESLVIAQTFSGPPAVDAGVQFGGGTGGGGGASAGF